MGRLGSWSLWMRSLSMQLGFFIFFIVSLSVQTATHTHTHVHTQSLSRLTRPLTWPFTWTFSHTIQARVLSLSAVTHLHVTLIFRCRVNVVPQSVFFVFKILNVFFLICSVICINWSEFLSFCCNQTPNSLSDTRCMLLTGRLTRLQLSFVQIEVWLHIIHH